jgi:hypothetical protein
MKLSFRQNAELERMKSEIAWQYGVENFEDIKLLEENMKIFLR